MKLTPFFMTCLFAATLPVAAVAVAAAGQSPQSPLTWCNPLPLPDYPVGRVVRNVVSGAPLDDASLWLLDHKEQYRELADPTALWHEGAWCLYPSCDMAWVSADNGATWRRHPLNIRDVGYAPTVVRHGGRFLLLASDSPLYASASPLGPFEPLGPMHLPRGSGAPGITDPMLFSDDDGRLYFYWGCTQKGGIWAVELDAKKPTETLGKPFEAIPFRPQEQPWEALGEWNQDTTGGWMEGAWMLKRNGTYYLTYSAAGTQNRTYAMGCYTAKSPLGPFTPQKHNPIFRSPEGLVTGTAHGCIVAGPQDQLWVFYTIRAGVAHGFERRLGMDRAEIGPDGELFVPGATSLPQWAPSHAPSGAASAATGWLPINGGVPTLGSSSAPNLSGGLAVDNELRTWWQPAANDPHPVLTSTFLAPATIHAVRVIWRDIGLNTTQGVAAGPFRYRVEVETTPGKWAPILDRSASTEDLLVDYRECPPATGAAARLVITGWPKGITPGVAEFTVFGQTNPGK